MKITRVVTTIAAFALLGMAITLSPVFAAGLGQGGGQDGGKGGHHGAGSRPSSQPHHHDHGHGPTTHKAS